MSVKRSFWVVAIWLCCIGVVVAQLDSCPAIVSEAILSVDEACSNLDRNSICYGNVNMTAIDFDGESIRDLSATGDTTEIINVASIVTSPFNSENGTWGIAILSLQADLPDTVPGQNVTFVVFGDTELTSQTIPDEQLVDAIIAQSTSNLNVREGDGTAFAIAGTLSAGQDVTIIGRNARSDWVQIEFEDSTAWVFAELLIIEDDLSALRVVGTDDTVTYSAPLQAFTLRSGIGSPNCEEVSQDGILVQAPTDTTVHFLINSIEVEVGSTAFIQSDGNGLSVSTFDGSVSVTSAGETQLSEPGTVVEVNANQAPQEAEPYGYQALLNLPLELLPDDVVVPFLVPPNGGWIDTGVEISAGDTFTLFAGGWVNFWDICETQKFDAGQPDIDCSSLIFGPAGGDPTTLDGDILGSDMSLFPVADALPHSLIGRIGDSTFYVGDGGEFTAEADGTLEFGVNDVDDNNLGGFFVGIILADE